MLYMVQTYWYSGYHVDNLFPTLSKLNAENYLHHLAMSYEDNGDDYEWESGQLILRAHGQLINMTEIVEMEFDKEIG